MLDPQTIKKDFPILQRQVHGKPLVYLDNSATSQKPQVVIDAISQYYRHSNANVHRGVHTLSDESTQLWEDSRQTVAHFFSARPEELVITRNTTEAMNGIAYGWGDHHLKEGDVILTTVLEHHSTLVTWQELCKRTGARLEFVGIKEDGQIDYDELVSDIHKLGSKIKVCSFVHVSNALGVVQPIESIVATVRHNLGQSVKIVLDCAQSAPHMQLDFVALDVDFLVFSGHKMLGPMGIGGLIVRREVLEEEFHPWLFGGGMISTVSKDETEYHPELTERFVAGTPDVASLFGLSAACDYLSALGMHDVLAHDQQLVSAALEMLAKIPEVSVVGPQQVVTEDNRPLRVGSVSFLYKGVHAHDVAQVLDSEGIAVRSGHHCTMPLHTHFGWQATTRASFQVYNSLEDVELLVAGLAKVGKVFS